MIFFVTWWIIDEFEKVKHRVPTTFWRFVWSIYYWTDAWQHRIYFVIIRLSALLPVSAPFRISALHPMCFILKSAFILICALILLCNTATRKVSFSWDHRIRCRTRNVFFFLHIVVSDTVKVQSASKYISTYTSTVLFLLSINLTEFKFCFRHSIVSQKRKTRLIHLSGATNLFRMGK